MSPRPRVGRYANAATAIHWAPDRLPDDTVCEPIVLPTPDGAVTTGVLYRPARATGTVVAIAHPRVDSTGHYLIPPLLRAGYAVWAQRTRTVNNDLNAVHEQLLIDLAVAHSAVLDRRFDQLYLLGNSGGASLYCLYAQQAARAPADRLGDTPAGAHVDLTLAMPAPAGVVLLAPHPGQGDLLLHCIDPSVIDEGDPVAADPGLDLFSPTNGFRSPPEPAHYEPTFLAAYRTAQHDRVARIDASAREALARRAAARAEGDRRRALAPTFLTVYRTDADPRSVALDLDPSDRDYGSIFGRRPDVTNYGPVGFGRLTTPEAWLSTWSAHATRAALRLTGPDVRCPVLVVAYTADNSVYPGDVASIVAALGSTDTTSFDVRGDHYGFAPATEDRTGGHTAAEHIVAWLDARRD